MHRAAANGSGQACSACPRLPRPPRSCPPLAVAAVSRLAKRPASAGLALTRRARPRQSRSEEDGTVQSGGWPVGSGFTDRSSQTIGIAADLAKLLQQPCEYPVLSAICPYRKWRRTAGTTDRHGQRPPTAAALALHGSAARAALAIPAAMALAVVAGLATPPGAARRARAAWPPRTRPAQAPDVMIATVPWPARPTERSSSLDTVPP
jgi:hypothetical protein